VTAVVYVGDMQVELLILFVLSLKSVFNILQEEGMLSKFQNKTGVSCW